MALQKSYSGVADFLGEYSLGNIQLNLGDTVVPVIDIAPFAEPLRTITSPQPLAAASPGTFFGAFAVPPGEIWLVNHYGWHTTAAVTATTEIEPMIQLPDGNQVGLRQRNSFSAVNGLFLLDGVFFPGGLRVVAGTEIGYFIVQLTAAGMPVNNVTISYQRISV